MIEDGVYEEKNITLPDYVNLIGINGDYDKVWIKGELPDSASDSEITPCSTINLTKSNTLSGLKITAKNMRYPVHDESGNAQHDWTRLVERCWIEHYGTEGAKQYREENNLTETAGYNSLWTSCHAWGEGASQGAVSHFNNCVFQSIEAAWYVHEGNNQESPYYHEFNNCIFNSITPYEGTFFNRVSVTIDNTRQSSDKNKLVFNGCQFSGAISINAVYPIQLVINGGDPMVIARWKNGGSSVVSYFSDKCYPFISNHMKKLMYNGDDHLTGGEILSYASMPSSAMPVVVKANSETDPNLFAGMAIGEADKGDPVLVLSGGYFYSTSNGVGKYVGPDDSGNIVQVSEKTKAFAVGLSGWWFKILH